MNQNTIVPNIGQWKIKEEFNVLSEFDGMSCGQLALQRVGKKVTNYFASEIDKYAMKVALKNFPNTKHLGDVTKIQIKDLPKIHLFIGGSPCQGFSFAGKQLNFSDPRSKLFFEFAADLRFIQEFINPEVKFFLENVKMKKEFQDVISRFLGVEPIFMDSNLISAQNRKRLYWTNIEGFTMPEDKGILLKDIVHENEFTISEECLTVPEATKKGFCKVRVGECVDLTFINSKTRRGRLMKDKCNCLTATSFDYNLLYDLNKYLVPFDKTLQILEKEVERGKVGYFRTDSQANRVYYIHGKSVTLCGDAGGGAAKMGQYLFGAISKITSRDFDISISDKGDIRPYRLDEKKSGISEVGTIRSTESKGNTLTTNHAPYIHTIEKDYLFGCITPDRIEKRQNGQRFSEGNKFYTLTAMDRHGILIEGYIRKLTPIECERLQTLPDNFTEGVSDSQRYKMCGNGWTVDAIAEFFKNL